MSAINPLSQRGQTMIKFALIAAVVILVAKVFGHDLKEAFNELVGFIIALPLT